jgi:WD40 repeat protein
MLRCLMARSLWSVAEGRPVAELEGHRGRVNSLAFSPDGTLLVSGSDDDDVRLWTVATGRLAKTLRGHKKWVNGVAFSPDGQIVGSGSSDGTIRLWEAPTDQ